MSEARESFPYQMVGGMDLCPYLHRVLLTARVAGYAAGRDFELRYWRVGEPPEWLAQLTPSVGSPVLQAADGAVSSDASLATKRIAALAPSMCRSELNALEVELLDQVDQVLQRLRAVFTAKSAPELDSCCGALFESLRPIEAALVSETLSLDPGDWTLVTCAYAPVCALIVPHAHLLQRPGWQQLPRVSAWMQRLVQHPLVLQSRCPDFALAFDGFFQRFGSYLPNAG